MRRPSRLPTMDQPAPRRRTKGLARSRVHDGVGARHDVDRIAADSAGLRRAPTRSRWVTCDPISVHLGREGPAVKRFVHIVLRLAVSVLVIVPATAPSVAAAERPADT